MTSGEAHRLTHEVLGACINVHRELGPGEDEIAYEEALSWMLGLKGIPHLRQFPLPLNYRGHVLDCGFRIDTLVNNALPLELKAVETLLPIHQAQLLTYLRLAEKPLGLLVNFDVPALRLGIRRLRSDRGSAPAPLDEGSVRTGDRTADELLRAAIAVHHALGPGLLRSAYEAALAFELGWRRIPFVLNLRMPIEFRGIKLTHDTTVPLLVDDRMPIMCLSGSSINASHVGRILNQLKRGGWRCGYVLNFNVMDIRAGVREVILRSR